MDNKKIDIENEKIEVSNKIIDKENEKIEDENYVEIKTDGINYIISHNQVLTVPRILKKDIEAGWKFCKWIDSYTGEEVKILDKDYWKSP